MPTTLILGGSGFVSGTIARTALARGDTTFVLTRGKREVPAGATPLVADRNDPAAFATALADLPFCDAVIDCIGFTADHAHQDLQTFFPENAAPRAGHLVFLSSDFVCSAVDRPLFIDESFDRFDTFPYALGKRAAEVALLDAATKRQLPITILRPCHIYGPGSLLGCLPLHGRDPQLLTRLKNGEPLKLIGGGYFLQQPMLASDLATAALACSALPKTRGHLYHIAGPEIIESRTFYRLIAELLAPPISTPITLHEASITDYLKEHPDHLPFCCHRVYSMEKARAHGIPVPATPVREGLRQHLQALGALS